MILRYYIQKQNEQMKEAGIVYVVSRYGQQVWVRSKLRKRQGDPCQICRNPIFGYAYRPITNGMNRYHRICERCMNEGSNG